MSTTESTNDTSKLNLWNTSINLGTMVGAGYYLGPDMIAKLGNSVVKWIPSPITSKEFAVAGAFNALAVSSAEYLTETDGIDFSFQKAFVATCALAAAALMGPKILNSLSNWTGMVFTTESIRAIAVFDGAIKAVSFGILFFAQFLKNSVSPKIPLNAEEARGISFWNLATLYDLLKENDGAHWDALPLSARTVLNMRFEKDGYDLLPFYGFQEAGDDLNETEITFLHEKTGSTNGFSAQQRMDMNALFYKAGLGPQDRAYSLAEMPSQVEKEIHSLQTDQVAKLSENTLRWIILYYSFYSSRKPIDQDLHIALCERLYQLKLTCPNKNFAPPETPPKISSLDHPTKEEIYLFGWFFAHFTNNQSEWNALPLDERFHWREAFLREPKRSMIVHPSLSEVKGLSREHTCEFASQYQKGGRSAWNHLDVTLQKALNLKFKEFGAVPLTIFPQTRADVGKMRWSDIQKFHAFLKKNPQFTHDLKPDAKDALTKYFAKCGLQMPGEAAPGAPSLLDRVNWKYVGLTVALATAVAVGIFYGPAILAFAKKHSPLGSNHQVDPECVGEDCSKVFKEQQPAPTQQDSEEHIPLTPEDESSGRASEEVGEGEKTPSLELQGEEHIPLTPPEGEGDSSGHTLEEAIEGEGEKTSSLELQGEELAVETEA